MMLNDQRITSKFRRESDKIERDTLNNSIQLIDKYIIRSVTDLNGVIIDVSQAFSDISGYSKDELLGNPHSIVRHPDMPSELFKDMWKTIQEGKVFSGEVKNLKKDGTCYWVSVNVEPNFNYNNEIYSYTAIRQDITDKKRFEELNKSLKSEIEKEVKKSTEQFKLVEEDKLKNAKLTSIGSLAAGITHEINTPLTYIKGNFEMMQYDIEDLPQSEIKERMMDDSKKILDGISRIANIVEAMREMSQTSKGDKEEADVYDTLVTALTISYNRSKQISRIFINDELFGLDTKNSGKSLKSLVQKQRIEQVWVVIINNALDELVKIDNYENRVLHIDIYEIDDKIIIKFIDNAGGINNSILNNIFEPFVSVKDYGGIGIGLNIAHKIIEEHQGSIRAYNEEIVNNDKKSLGAVFEICLNKI